MIIRGASGETDVAAIMDICNACEPAYPVRRDEVLRWFQHAAPGSIQLRLVAEDSRETVTGYACAIHSTTMPARHFYVWVGVAPEARCQGTGAALWNACLRLLREHHATRLSSEVLDTYPPGLAFAQQRGFAIDRHRFHSALDLATFDEAPYLPALAALEGEGIRFCSLANFPDAPEIRDKFMRLNIVVVRDIPGEVWDFDGYPQFFNERIIGGAWFRWDGALLAVDGDTWAGFATVQLIPATQSAYNATTGVVRAYRGRKIAQSLKVMAARYAREHGAREIGTDNDSLNEPMLAINRKMGYRPRDGKYALVRWLEEGPG